MIRNQTRRRSPPRCIQSSLEFSVRRKCFVQIPLNQLIRRENGVGDRKSNSSGNDDNDMKNDEVVIYWPGVLVKDLVNFADFIRQKMENLSSQKKEKYDFELEKEILKAATSPSHSGVFLFGRIKFNTTCRGRQRRISYMVPYGDYPIAFSTDTNNIWGKVDVVDGYVEALQESLQFWELYSVRSAGNDDDKFYDQIVANNYFLEDDVSIDSSTSESDDDNDSDSDSSSSRSEVGNVFGVKNVTRDNIVSPSRSCSDDTSSMAVEMSRKQGEEGMMKIISREPPPSSMTEEKRRTQFDNILINRGDEAHKVDTNKEYAVSKKNTTTISQERTNLSESRSNDQEKCGKKVNTQVNPENPDDREAQRLIEANATKKTEEGRKINEASHMVGAESKGEQSTEVTSVAQAQVKAKIEQQAKEASETKMLVDLDRKRNKHIDTAEGEINAKEVVEGKRKCIIKAAQTMNTKVEKEKVIEAKAQINVQEEEIRIETQETQQQKLYVYGERVTLVGFELESNRQYNGKQGMVTSLVPFSSTSNHLIYLSEFYDNENRDVVWYNVLFANDENRVIPSIHLRCVFRVDYGHRVNDMPQNLDVKVTAESKNSSRKTSEEQTESGTQKEYGKNITHQQIPNEATAVSKKPSRKAHIMETQNQNFRKGRLSTLVGIGKTITVNFSDKQLGLLIVNKSTLKSANDADAGTRHGGLVVVSGFLTEELSHNDKSYKKVNIGDELLSIGDTNVQKESVNEIVNMISKSERPIQITFLRRKRKKRNQEEKKKKIANYMTENPDTEATIKSKKPGRKGDSQVRNQSNSAVKATTETEEPVWKRGRLIENKSSYTVPKSTHSKSNDENNVELECSVNNKKQGKKTPGYWDEARKSKYRSQHCCSLHRKGVCWNCDCCWKCDHPPFCSKYLHRRKKLHKNIVAGASLDTSCKSITSTNTKTSRKKRSHADISSSLPVGLDISSSKKRKGATNEMQESISGRRLKTNTPDKMKSKPKNYSDGEEWLYKTYRYQVIKKIPTFTEVKKTLEEAGHIFRDGTFTAPLGRGKIQTFLSENDYREYLCRDGVTLKGVNNRDASRERKYMTLMTWVCYHRVEKLLGQTVVPIHYTGKDIHSEWKQILTELGIHRSAGGKWSIPRIKGKVEDFTFTHRLAQEGIPEYLVEESNVSKYYHILLELHCSCPMRRFLYYPFFR